MCCKGKSQRLLQILKKGKGAPLKKRGGNGAAELGSERAEEPTGQHFNDAFNKTEYNEVPLTRRSAPFMDSIVVSTEGVIYSRA